MSKEPLKITTQNLNHKVKFCLRNYVHYQKCTWISIEVIINNGTVLCDDYDLSHAPGVKKAIDEFVLKNNFKCTILEFDRFAKIEKN